MKSKLVQSIYLTLLLAIAVAAARWLVSTPGAEFGAPEPSSPHETLGLEEQGVSLEGAYESWLEHRKSSRTPGEIVLKLGFSKGLSTEHTSAHGEAILRLADGYLSVSVQGDLSPRARDVWLVDNATIGGSSVLPEEGDRVLFAGSLTVQDGQAFLETVLDKSSLEDFEPDLVVVTPVGVRPEVAGVLFGVPDLFQRRYVRDFWAMEQRRKEDSWWHGLWQTIVPRANAARRNRRGPNLDALIEEGERIFFEEIFDGNGRTCGTCHPAENNFMVDAEFIATLHPNDPLFVAEFVPELAANFEKPELMRQLGLIVENLDGFDDLDNKFVMRAVPHLFSMARSLQPPRRQADGIPTPPRHRLGWSGDGSTGQGTLREFTIGAVRQHFPLTLGREFGVDFRAPTDDELDAVEAFMLSLGRNAEPNVRRLVPRDGTVRDGWRIFLRSDSRRGRRAAGKCNICHTNAGSNFRGRGGNRNFDTGVEDAPDQPADLIDPTNPADGGFGTEEDPANPGVFGNGTFNTPRILEAADTAPFFHNNSFATIEDAVSFYASDAFNSSPAGRFLAGQDSGGIGIELEPEEAEAIAAFLRVINASENVRQARQLQRRAQEEPLEPMPDLSRAIAELTDAIEVLSERGLHSDIVANLNSAVMLTESALADPDPVSRNATLDSALDLERTVDRALFFGFGRFGGPGRHR